MNCRKMKENSNPNAVPSVVGCVGVRGCSNEKSPSESLENVILTRLPRQLKKKMSKMAGCDINVQIMDLQKELQTQLVKNRLEEKEMKLRHMTALQATIEKINCLKSLVLKGAKQEMKEQVKELQKLKGGVKAPK